MKKRQIGILLMVLGMIGASSATRILWCSSGTNDQGWVDLLVADGYTVDRLETAATMTADKVTLANTYDLVIVGRDTDGAGYATNSTEVGYWNSITKPLICQSAYIVHSGRWKWLNNSSAASYTETTFVVDLAAGNPLYEALFKGVTVNESGVVNYYDASTSSPVALVGTASAGNGTLIGHRDHTSAYVYAAYWAQGVEFYAGSGYTAAGPRMALFAGGGAPRGGLNVTEDGKLMFLNAAYYMSGATFNRKPFVSAGTDRIANVGQTITLDASTFDPDSTLTISWTQVSGPAAAVFEDAAAVDAKVTFPVKGVYTLKLTVSDGTTTVADQMTVTVRDSADNAMIAHWDFESLPEPNSLTDVTGNGFTGIYHRSTSGDPNVAAGNLFGGSQAADLTAGDAYWEVANSYANTDPNFNDLATGMTVAAWVKISDSSIGAPMIVGTGLDGWRLQVNGTRYNLTCRSVGDLYANGTNAYDGVWHYVVGVYDGVASQVSIYVDGLLAGTAPANPGSLISKGEAYPLIQIANRGDADRPWKGYIDDIRIYNYPLSDSEIAALAAEGNLRVKVTAGSDQTVAYKGVPVQLSGALLSDDGYPALATLGWSVVSVPEGADPAAVMFNNASIANPQVTFPNVQGTYILRLTANDTEYTVFDDVNIMILIPSCADVIADGLGFAADISGPQNVSDCRIDIHDFAEMASNWLRCNDPRDEDCEWAYQQ
jgi:hypothetical protein